MLVSHIFCNFAAVIQTFMEINEIIDGNYSIEQKVTMLKNSKRVNVPSWDNLVKQYDSRKHKVNDQNERKDKKKSDGTYDKVTRISLPLQKLAVKRMAEFVVGIPVRRLYHYDEGDEVSAEIAASLEKIYMKNHIDSENMKRMRDYFASCEICTQWYSVDADNAYYGFTSKKKLRCKTFSPKDGYKLYPFFDGFGDLLAMSVEYSEKELPDNTLVYYFETYTESRHVRLKRTSKGYEVDVDEENTLGKIPFSYMHRESPIWDEVSNLVDEMEKALSNNGDVIDYNAAPILAVSGSLVGSEEKGSTRRVFQLEQGGSINYVSWSQAPESLKFQIEYLMRFFWLCLQLPDISLENIKGSLVSGEARKTLLTDAHLKVKDESGDILIFFEREMSIVKTMLKDMRPDWSQKIDEMDVEHVITPFIQQDEEAEIKKWVMASGGKPVMSQLEAIKNLGISADPNETMEQLKNEQIESERAKMQNLFAGHI